MTRAQVALSTDFARATMDLEFWWMENRMRAEAAIDFDSEAFSYREINDTTHYHKRNQYADCADWLIAQINHLLDSGDDEDIQELSFKDAAAARACIAEYNRINKAWVKAKHDLILSHD